MDYAVTKNLFAQKTTKKNLFLALLCGSMLINILQGIERLTVTEKVVVLPPVIQKDIWIKGNAVSESYLEEWALYLSNLLLNVSKHTIGYQSELALRHVSPELSGKMQVQFKKDAENLTKNNATTTFLPKEIVVDEQKLTVRVTGMFATYVGKEQVSSHEQTYTLKFVFNKGRFLQLTQFKQMSTDKTINDDDGDVNETDLKEKHLTSHQGTKQ